jgi:mannose-1-phosphate guanylyltransferase/phosphomannomutase
MRSKARLTITLARDLLRQIDHMIDKQLVRNRSHAIEMLLRDSLKSRVTTAVILTGGRSDQGLVPALLQVSNQPLILITLGHLINYGIHRIFILAGEWESEFREAIGGTSFLGASINYTDEDRPMGTAGAVKRIEAQLAHEPFLVLHGDVLTDINLADFIEFHKNENSLATIAVKPRDAERRYGKLLLQGNKVTSFSETESSEGISIVNTGVYMLQPEALSLIDTDQPAQFERDIFPKLAAIGELSAFFFQGIWFDISMADSYRKAQKRWANR